MTAEELIAQLKALPPVTKILVEGYETGYDDIEELRPLEVFRYRKAQEWDGEYQTHDSFSGNGSATHPAAVIRGRRGPVRNRKTKKKYALADLVNQCDQDALMPPELQKWESAPAVGLEQQVVDKLVDISEVATRFADKILPAFDVDRIILFGSRARGNYQPDSYVDVAVILRQFPGDYMEIKMALCTTAYDVLVETNVRIQPIPISAADWKDPGQHADPDLLERIALEGITLWHS